MSSFLNVAIGGIHTWFESGWKNLNKIHGLVKYAVKSNFEQLLESDVFLHSKKKAKEDFNKIKK